MNLLNAPSKALIIVAGVFGVILTLYFTIQYIQKAERDKITIELQKEVKTVREEIRNELKSVKPVDRNDATDSLQWLEDRQRGR